jgi:hypothetical protein
MQCSCHGGGHDCSWSRCWASRTASASAAAAAAAACCLLVMYGLMGNGITTGHAGQGRGGKRAGVTQGPAEDILKPACTAEQLLLAGGGIQPCALEGLQLLARIVGLLLGKLQRAVGAGCWLPGALHLSAGACSGSCCCGLLRRLLLPLAWRHDSWGVRCWLAACQTPVAMRAQRGACLSASKCRADRLPKTAASSSPGTWHIGGSWPKGITHAAGRTAHKEMRSIPTYLLPVVKAQAC